jgi:hypothetical protein
MSLKMTSAALAGVAVLLMIAVQFLPWLYVKETVPEFSSFGFTRPEQRYTTEANTWDRDVIVESGGERSESDQGWFDDSYDDTDGLGTMRTGILMLAGTSLVVVVGAVLTMLGNRFAALTTLAAGILLLAATVVFTVGLNILFDDIEYTWTLSFYGAIAACLCTLGSGVVGYLATQRTGTTTL